MRWLLYIKIVCGNKKNLVLTHSDFYIFVFLVLKGDVVEMNENNKDPLSEEPNIDNPNYWKNENKALLGRVSDVFDRQTDRQTRYSSIKTSTVYKLKCGSQDVKQVSGLLAKCKDSRISRISVANENKENHVDNTINKDEEKSNENEEEKEDEKEKKNPNNGNGNKNLVLLIEVDQEDAETFRSNFDQKKKEIKGLSDLNLEKDQELCTVDLGKDENDAKVELTPEDEKLIERIHAKKWHLLRTLTHDQQCNFINKLIELADDKYKKQREALLERHNLPEYRYWLNLIFNSGHLTFDALVKLADVVSKRQITENNFTSVLEICKSFWVNPFADLADRDISGKRDRLRVMITPEGQAIMVACHIKLFQYLINTKRYNGNQLAAVYDVAIQTLKDEYSKNNREFWFDFLFYVVGFSFLMTLAGAIVTALLGLSGFAALAPCAVLLVTTLLKTGATFHKDYGIFPWDWIYWWKDAKANCLKVLQSDYMKDVLIKGQTSELDKEIRQEERKIAVAVEEKNEAVEEKKEDAELDKISLSKSNKKAMKSKRKLGRFLFWLSMIIFAVSVMIAFYPSVVATAIPLVLSVFKLDVAFTIAPLVSGICMYIAVAAIAAALIFHVMQSNYNNEYQQCKFDTYQTYIPADKDNMGNVRYYTKLNGDKGFYTKEELEAAGINVEVNDKEEIN